MDRPYIICHMMTSIDGKVTGNFLSTPACTEASDVYYRLNRELEANGFICGRVTMESSFTGGWYPDLSQYRPAQPPREREHKVDYIVDDLGGFYAVAFDTNGKLGWKSNRIVDPDGDPGYDGAQIIEVLSEDVDDRYLGYLESMQIPYIFAGETSIDVELALFKLKHLIGCKTLLLEGGSIINGAFERAGAVDELSLVMVPVVAGSDGKPLFMEADMADFSPVSADREGDILVLKYRKK